MINKLSQIKKTLLMGPGPSCVSDSVYQALAKPTLGHLDPEFISLMDEIKEFLKKMLQTDNQLTVPISGTGSAGMETCFVNLVEPGDKALILINGVFGSRMEDVASRLGGNVETLNFEWGTVVDLNVVKEKLNESKYTIMSNIYREVCRDRDLYTYIDVYSCLF